jgi:hypothetical protein
MFVLTAFLVGYEVLLQDVDLGAFTGTTRLFLLLVFPTLLALILGWCVGLFGPNVPAGYKGFAALFLLAAPLLILLMMTFYSCYFLRICF